MQNRVDETWHRLSEWTYGQTQSERLAAQILIQAGYNDIDPIHPLGGRDGGKDGISNIGGITTMAVYFPRGQKTFSEIKKKFELDLQGAKNNSAAAMAFVTNQELSDSERSQLTQLSHPVNLELFHLERLTAILDSPHMESVRKQFLAIDFRDSASRSSNSEKSYKRALDAYDTAHPLARNLIVTHLPPSEYLAYLERYNFRSGRIPIVKHERIADLYQKIERAVAFSKNDFGYHGTYQSREGLQILNALPALGVFRQRLAEHYLSIQQFTSTEIIDNPTHLGIFTHPDKINPNEGDFSKIVIAWETSARDLAISYRNDILC